MKTNHKFQYLIQRLEQQVDHDLISAGSLLSEREEADHLALEKLFKVISLQGNSSF